MTSGGEWSPSERRAHEQEQKALADLARILDEAGSLEAFIMRVRIGIGQSDFALSNEKEVRHLQHQLELITKTFEISNSELVLQVRCANHT